MKIKALGFRFNLKDERSQRKGKQIQQYRTNYRVTKRICVHEKPLLCKILSGDNYENNYLITIKQKNANGQSLGYIR